MLKNLIPQSIKNMFHFTNALLAVIYHGYPARKLTVIGVTGTDGKTTTSTLVYHILKTAGKKVALISTVAAYIGQEEVDTGFHVTSPDPWSLQKLIRRISNQGYDHLVLEATSHGLDQHRLLGANFQIGILTNVTHEHLDYHKSYDHYLKAKAKLLQVVDYAIVNKLDQSFEKIKKLVRLPLITYDNRNLPSFVKKRFSEKYNQLNAQAAIASARLLQITESQIEAAILSFPGVIGRMEEIPTKSGIRVIVDFAHTPNALKMALQALRETTKGKLIAVYGSAGLRDKSKRPMMGEVGARLANEVILTVEDSRTEDVNTIIMQMKTGVKTNHGHVHAITDRQTAINFAIVNLAKKGDTVGIFGKGHERSMNLDGHSEIPWSDHKAARIALAIRSKKQ